MATLIQIFGTKKCSDTRKAERWWKERGMKTSFLDLKERGPSPGELKSIASAVGGVDKLIDREGTHYRDRGLLYASPTGPRIEQHLIDDPLLLRTPVVRCAKKATVGVTPETIRAWEEWLRDGTIPEKAPR